MDKDEIVSAIHWHYLSLLRTFNAKIYWKKTQATNMHAPINLVTAYARWDQESGSA